VSDPVDLDAIGDLRALCAAIEAVLLVATEPVEPVLLAQLVEIPTAAVEAICARLAGEYAAEGRGFTIARIAGGYRFQTAAEQAPYVERMVLEGQTARLSGPALETLAIVAYKQPISRAQLSAIRGVNVDATLRTLVQRGYVEESGHEATPGNPALFSTTKLFLDKLGIDALSDLPPLADFIPDAGVVEALERGLRITDAPPASADEALSDDDTVVLDDPPVDPAALMAEVATEKASLPPELAQPEAAAADLDLAGEES
jgi:segregation and condensation protein B